LAGSGRTYVIGDLHGCAEELDTLLDALSPATGDTLCFLGDYVDRGPSPRDVIERLIRLETEGPRCVFLKGNHEDMFLAYLGYGGQYGDAFLANGGGSTLRSYGVPGRAGRDHAKYIPEPHRDFLLALRSEARFGEFLCVHAGVRPTRPLEAQLEEDRLWIREEFTATAHPFPCTVVFGHTPYREVLVHLPFKVGLDTGLVYGNKLSCLDLESKELMQVRRGAREVQRASLAGQFADAPSPVA
jgi:serine/threonine protein phosphatase 1